MAYDPTRRVPSQGYPPPQVPPGYPQQPYPAAGPSPSGYVPGYAPPQVPPGYPPPSQPIVTSYGAQPGASGSFWASLGRGGQGALLSGVALLIIFFLPWLSTPDFNNTQSFTSTSIPLTTYSGFSTASGITLNNLGGNVPSLSFNLFAALWMVPVGAIGLLIVVWLLNQRRITTKTASAIVMVISAAIVLAAFAFLLEVNSIESVITSLYFSSGRPAPETLVSVAPGFWAGVVAAAVGLLAGASEVFQGGRAPAGVYQ